MLPAAPQQVPKKRGLIKSSKYDTDEIPRVHRLEPIKKYNRIDTKISLDKNLSKNDMTSVKPLSYYPISKYNPLPKINPLPDMNPSFQNSPSKDSILNSNLSSNRLNIPVENLLTKTKLDRIIII